MEKIKKAAVDQFDIEELACKITGLDYDEIDGNYTTIENAMYEQYNVEMDDFTRLIRVLLPLVDIGKSPLTNKRYKGFSDIENQRWIIKMELQ